MSNSPRYLVPSVFTFNPSEHLELREAAAPIVPYDHQRATWDALTKHYVDAGKCAGLVVLPTGGGKTVVAAHWLLQNVIAKGGRVLWLAPRRERLKQASAPSRGSATSRTRTRRSSSSSPSPGSGCGGRT